MEDKEEKIITAQDVMALAFANLKPLPGLISQDQIEALKKAFGYEDVKPA